MASQHAFKDLMVRQLARHIEQSKHFSPHFVKTALDKLEACDLALENMASLKTADSHVVKAKDLADLQGCQAIVMGLEQVLGPYAIGSMVETAQAVVKELEDTKNALADLSTLVETEKAAAATAAAETAKQHASVQAQVSGRTGKGK